MRWIFLCFYGFFSGMLISAGIFAVLIELGMTPRFAGGTGTASKIMWYETCIIAGTVCGCLLSLFEEIWEVGKWVRKLQGMSAFIPDIIGKGILSLEGFFGGVFVGCLALSIAEMLKSIPIFRRRIQLRYGMEWAVFSLAVGKLVGSLFYFLNETKFFNG